MQEVLCAPLSPLQAAFTEYIRPLHPFAHWIIYPFIPQVLGAPCSLNISFSGVSWLKPELGEELPM